MFYCYYYIVNINKINDIKKSGVIYFQKPLFIISTDRGFIKQNEFKPYNIINFNKHKNAEKKFRSIGDNAKKVR